MMMIGTLWVIVGVGVVLLHDAAAECPTVCYCNGTMIDCGGQGLTPVPNVTWDGNTEILCVCGGAGFQ